MKIIPENNSALCRLVVKKNETAVESGIEYTAERLPQYEVVSTSGDFRGLDLRPGDVVICNSTGTRLMLNGTEYFVFKSENIAARIETV